MIADFWLGVLAASTVALGLIVTIGASLLVWFIQWAAKFAAVELRKDPKGAVVVSAEVRAK